jgi:23S rRNA (cytosine1962-C5)-methyltransferase
MSTAPRSRRTGDHGAMPDERYTLIDAGDGRRLEAFGELLVDRPAPAAGDARRDPERWTGAASYLASGWWAADGTELGDVAARVQIAGVTLEARPAASGQVGVFPEHAVHGSWLARAIGGRLGDEGGPGGHTAEAPEVLNLFAHTGLATLVAAKAGARVAHVDASRPSVAWARRNAELSGLAEGPIRWLVDDALAFVRRESRRGRRYAGLVIDPPSYGHGGRGGRPAWVFEERIVELLDACAGVADPDAFWVLTTHTPGWDPDRLAATLAMATDVRPADVEELGLVLEAETGARLRLGAAARFDPLGPHPR